MNKLRLSAVRKRLERDIHRGVTKKDFSPFDIYQFVNEDRKEAFLEEQYEEGKTSAQDVVGLLLSAHREVYIFAGKFSWSNLVRKGIKIIDVLEDLARKGVKIKIISGIHLPAMDNIEKILELNNKLPKEQWIEVRHSFQPLRAIIVDDKIMRLKEVKKPSDYGAGSKKKKTTFIFYSIYDKDWIRWLRGIFMDYFKAGDYPAARVRELKKIQKVEYTSKKR
ncbi:hypothetical protein ACFLZZ_01875 [Nanoarchaeota archaeon]